MSVGAINNIHKSTIYAFTEDGFFASFSIFQYCIPYWFYSESTTLWLVKSTGNSADLFSSDSWNLYCTYSRIWAPTWKLEVRASEIDLLFSVTLWKTQCAMHFILQLQQIHSGLVIFFIKSEDTCACILCF